MGGDVYQDEWVNHLVRTFGQAANGGVRFYSMDNEPDLWADNTHLDVHPVRPGYDGMLSGFLEFEVEAPAGTVLDFYGFEFIHDGQRQDTYRVDNTIRYICRAGRQRYISPVRRGLRYLMKFKPGTFAGRGGFLPDQHYYYGQYYAAQAMWTAGPKFWNEWFPAIRDELLRLNRTRTDSVWSDPNVCSHYATAMACIILQIPNNYLPILQK